MSGSRSSDHKTYKNRDNYPHPIVKNTQLYVEETHETVIPTYQPFIPSHQQRTSAAFIRYTNLAPSLNSPFTLFINPFHPQINNLPTVAQTFRCPNCQSFINPLSQILSSNSYACNVCQGEVKGNVRHEDNFKGKYAYKYERIWNNEQAHSVNGNEESEGKRQQICFVIQASEYNFNKKVHKSIINCINALRNEHLSISLVFFDDRYIMFLDIQTKELMKMPIQSDQPEYYSLLPMGRERMFQPISHFNQEVVQIIESIMYESLFIERTILKQVVSLFNKCLPHSKVLFFITTLNQIGQQQPNQSNKSPHLFKSKQNLLGSLMSKINLPIRINKPSSQDITLLNLNERMSFFVIGIKTTLTQCISSLKYNLHKFYNGKECVGLECDLYYDLYQNITTPSYYNTQFNIKTSLDLDIIIPDTDPYNLYQNISVQVEKKEAKFKSYKVVLNHGNPSTFIPLRFVINQVESSKHCKGFFQIEYTCNENGNPKHVILNGGCLKVHEQRVEYLRWIDDEALFNDDLRQCLQQWDKQNYKELKASLIQKASQLLQSIKYHNKLQSFNLPLNMKHYFLYLYMIIARINEGKLHFYHIFQLINYNLETASKMLYARSYRVQNDSIRNIKSSESIFSKDGILLIQNGERLFLILNDVSVEQIKQIFGYYDEIASLANAHLELPEIQTNNSLRNAITIIRERNSSVFLRLKIVDKESEFFQSSILPLLYKKTDHFQLMRRLWKSIR